MNYEDFIASKRLTVSPTGLMGRPVLHDALYPFQSDIVAWALRLGRAAIFADCGLGKTLMQLEWARHVPGDVLLLAPLAVGSQTETEAHRFGIDAAVSRDGRRAAKITITNYERLDKFTGDYAGVVLDESSIIKSFTGKIRNSVIDRFAETPFRLACTATPAPNDHMELGNHAEFLGVMSRTEMLATFFVHDGGDTSQWRLKGHAEGDFWRWVASWAAMVRKPSDLGYSDDGFVLPPMDIHEHLIETGHSASGTLFVEAAKGLTEQRKARKRTLSARVDEVARLVNNSDESWLVWCELNAEGDALTKAIPDAIQVAGADNDEKKAEKLLAFTNGESRVLVTKPKIAGFGMNWQHAHNMAFVGLSNSYEQFYQAVRREWRFGQKSKVNVHVVTTDLEVGVLHNIKRKQDDADKMAIGMVEHMRETMKQNIYGQARAEDPYMEDVKRGDGWELFLGDSAEVVKGIGADSIHYTVFSPPFASLYTYSNSPRDMGNCRDHGEFYDHFRFLVGELYRITMPGRLLSFHCMNLPTSKERDGFIGIRDFRGEMTRLFTDAGWIFHSEVCIWKDPVTAMQRTKALGLLHKQLKKDSCMSRQGIADYLVTMRKPGDNPERVTHTNESFPVGVWQNYASPVWDDINPSDTLQYRSTREDKDEKHICPLQLGVIRRALRLWSNEGDTVFSPFAGIGSEGYVSLDEGRKFKGVELKRSYWEQACRNLKAATMTTKKMFV